MNHVGDATKSSDKWTPGPWIIGDINGTAVCAQSPNSAEWGVVAYAGLDFGKYRKANMSLIAEAPELLVALRRLVARAESATHYIEVVDDEDDQQAINNFMDAIRLGREAIAKVEGG